MNPYLLDSDFRGTLGSADGSRSFPIFFWNLAEKRDVVRPRSGRH